MSSGAGAAPKQAGSETLAKSLHPSEEQQYTSPPPPPSSWQANSIRLIWPSLYNLIIYTTQEGGEKFSQSYPGRKSS